ncbi:recombinase family protein [Streptosporangium canum]|uniref:recombinase family protein n=1 Tax=Streptosporangium canum TaxID=324952 RepID=UPI00342A17BD
MTEGHTGRSPATDGQRWDGYARCSTNEQDVIVRTQQLRALDVETDRVYIDCGFSGTTRTNRAGRSCRHPPMSMDAIVREVSKNR